MYKRQDEGSVTVDDETVFENTKVKARCFYIPDEPYFLSNGTAVAEENAGVGSIYRLTAEAAAVLQNENTEWTVLCVDYKNGS